MGLIDRFAKAVADQLEKSPMLPAGAVSMTEQQMQQAARDNSYTTKPNNNIVEEIDLPDEEQN